MRLFFTSVLLCAFASSALAAPADYDQPQASVYMSFSFDRPAATAKQPVQAALRYGFAFDHAHRSGNIIGVQPAPLLRWEFSQFKFDNLSIAGQPLLNRQMLLAADDEDGGAFGFVKDHFGIIAISVAGAITVGALVIGNLDTNDRNLNDVDGKGSPRNTN